MHQYMQNFMLESILMVKMNSIYIRGRKMTQKSRYFDLTPMNLYIVHGGFENHSTNIKTSFKYRKSNNSNKQMFSWRLYVHFLMYFSSPGL